MTRSLPLPGTPAAASGVAGPPSRRRWHALRRLLVPAFAVAVLALLISNASEIDWSGAWRALRGYEVRTVLVAALLAVASHVLYGSFDLLGRSYTGHGLPAGRVWATACVSYAFNLNLGSLVGGFGLRLRLYARQGLRPAVIARLIGFSMVTNWLGYLALAGGILGLGAISVPPGWPLHAATLRIVGAGLLLAVLGYLAACAGSKRREWIVRGHRIELPPATLAAMQLLLSMTNWMLMGGVIFVLLGGKIPYPTALGVLLLAGIAGVVTHVPAGLGVLEAVFLVLLGGQLSQATVLGAMLAYRALYYLAPMSVALLLYALLEGMAGRTRPA